MLEVGESWIYEPRRGEPRRVVEGWEAVYVLGEGTVVYGCFAECPLEAAAECLERAAAWFAVREGGR